jgi:acarbose 7IV-phosphotransferase
MSRILVSGLINIETTVQVESFPIDYTPVRYPFFGVASTVSGVGFNIAKALTTLGDTVPFLSFVGRDPAGNLVRDALNRLGIEGTFIVEGLEQTPQSVILYDKTGRRQINVDLKDIQEEVYPAKGFDTAIKGCSLAALCNINFSRPLLERARHAGVPIATDVHAISKLDDEYNRDFMDEAQVLFMSDASLPCAPRDWVKQVLDRHGCEIIVVGLGADGVLLSVKRDRFMERIPAVMPRKLVNTIGAGDALFSAFIHGYARTGDPYESIRKAVLFASHKISAAGAADGFLDGNQLDRLYAETNTGLRDDGPKA